MTRYGLKTNIRSKITFGITVISMLLGSLFYPSFENFLTNFSLIHPFFNKFLLSSAYLGFFTTSVTVISLYTIIKFLFNKWIWKIHFIKKLSMVPNLNGIWKGTLESSYKTNGETTKIEMELKIDQTWESMVCISNFKESESINDLVLLDNKEPSKIKLFFTYSNTSHDINCKMEQYLGCNELILSGNHLNGFYFTKRSILTFGRINLTKCNAQEKM